MARKPRIFVSGGIYHVYCRVARGERVFDDPVEAETWIQIVANEMWIHDVSVLAWCLMSNHYHLVVRTGARPLWRPMAAIQGRVAKGFNRARGFVGRLWQSRYKARLVQDARYLDHLFAYVHLNPVAAGIVEDPADFRSSGHRELLGLVPSRLCDVPTALLHFDADPSAARSAYLTQVRVVAEIRYSPTEVRRLPWWKTVPDDDETVTRAEAPEIATDYLGATLQPERSFRPRIEAVLRSCEDELGLVGGALSLSSRTKVLSWSRCVFSTFAVSLLGYPTHEVAKILDKAPGSVSRWVSEGVRNQRVDPDFRKTVGALARRFADDWPDAELFHPSS